MSGIPDKFKKESEDITFNVIGGVFFLMITFICFYPFYYLFICTISNNLLVDLNLVVLYPQGIHFKNYQEIFLVQGLAKALTVSVARVLITTSASFLCTSYMAYCFSKQNMWGRKVLYRLTVITMYFSAGMIPVYLNNNMLGLTNSFLIYVIPAMISVYNMVLIKTSIEQMGPSLEEAAIIDGAGFFSRYFLIVLPLQIPIMATVSLFTAVNQWNDFFTTKLYITNTDLYTVQYLLFEKLNQVKAVAEQITTGNPGAGITATGIRLTMTAVVVIPIFCVYPFIQRFYIKGIMVGAVKG